MLFASSGLGVLDGALNQLTERERIATFGQGCLLVRSRMRITRDGGHSLLAVSDPNLNTRLGRVSTSPPADNGWSRSRTTTESTLINGDTELDDSVSPPVEAKQAPTFHPAPAPLLRPMKDIPPRYRSLISVLRNSRDTGYSNVKWSYLGAQRKMHTDLYPNGGLRSFLEDAQAEGLVVIGGYAGNDWVELADDV
jgi:hypothetical protein